MYQNYKDSHTDYKNNWIEEAIIHAKQCLLIQMPKEKICELFKEIYSTNNETIFLIMQAANILYEDTINNYKGD